MTVLMKLDSLHFNAIENLPIKMMGSDFLQIMQTASLCVTSLTQLCVSHLRLRSWIDIRLNVAQLCFNRQSIQEFMCTGRLTNLDINLPRSADLSFYANSIRALCMCVCVCVWYIYWANISVSVSHLFHDSLACSLIIFLYHLMLHNWQTFK